MNDKAKVLIVDDSIIFRHVMLEVIEKIADAECVGTAASGEIALRKIESLNPDLVLLDVVMPGLDGAETLCYLKTHYPHIQAIMVSGFDMQNAKTTLESLEIGALDFISKPIVKNHLIGIEQLRNQLFPLIQLVITKKYAALSRQAVKSEKCYQNNHKLVTSSPYTILPTTQHIELIVIGVSTGGPKALEQMIPTISVSIPCPILIVQHMPPLFTQSLAEKLQEKTQLKVTEAQDGELIEAGHVYIAPGGRHLVVRRKLPKEPPYLAINDTPPVNNCRPSIDVLLRSVARVIKGNVLAIMMTGMGRDGTDGVRVLKRQGNHHLCFIQDEASSIVWGMPGSVYRAGLADKILPLDKLGQRMTELALQ